MIARSTAQREQSGYRRARGATFLFQAVPGDREMFQQVLILQRRHSRRARRRGRQAITHHAVDLPCDQHSQAGLDQVQHLHSEKHSPAITRAICHPSRIASQRIPNCSRESE